VNWLKTRTRDSRLRLDVELSKLFMRPFRRPQARRVHITEDRARIFAVWNYQNNPSFSELAPLIKQYFYFNLTEN